MVTSTTLDDIAHQRWGITLSTPGGRFDKTGWFFDKSLADQCPTCGRAFECCRKPYTTKAGKRQLYIALVCPSCRTAQAPGAVGLGGYASLATRSEAESPARSEGVPAAAAVLEYWQAIELFESQDVELPSSVDRRHGIWARRTSITQDSPPPWEALEAAGETYPHRVAYTVLIGIYRKDALHAAMATALQDIGFGVDERTPRGHSALFSLEVDEHGIPDLESVTMASAPWALGQLLRDPTGTDWISDFELTQSAFTEQVARTLGLSATQPEDDDIPEPTPLTGADIHALSRTASAFLRVDEALSPTGSVASRYRPARDPRAQRTDGFLNSMLAMDLHRVAQAIHDEAPSGALGSYLSSVEPSRTDVTAESSREELAGLGGPASIPAGRWPSKPDEPLSTSQQLAVNAICAMPHAGSGLFGVNGPPGTGKSTLLRDVVAGVVTSRAHALAQLDSPTDAFTIRKLGWSTENYTHTFRALSADIAGHEIIVASSNNGAVENVSRELPDSSQVADQWSSEAYFIDAARRAGGDSAWGLLSAVLGRASNRSDFVQEMWWGKENDSPSDSGRSQSRESNARSKPLFPKVLESRANKHTPDDWDRAVAAFTAAVEEEERIRTERQAAFDLIQRGRALHDQAQESLQLEQRLRATLDERVSEHRTTENDVAAAEASDKQLQAERQLSLERKPPWWEWFRDLGSARREWRRHHEELTDSITRLTHTRRALGRSLEAAHQAVSAAQSRVTEQEEHTSHIRAEQDAVDQQLATLRADCSFQIPDDAWWEDLTAHEVNPPWVDAEWNAARTAVFIAALHLHETFIVATWNSHFYAGLNAAMDVVTGAPRGAPRDAVTEAWRYLFVLVPVVSTTFASMASMFSHVPSQSFGWLIIDEAGQAVPQAAVGGIWRTQRTVAVGDPLQLEPIVSAMHSTQNQLRGLWDVDEEWMPGRLSVQQLADRATWLGTTLSTGIDEEQWVGAPLRAHRRCDEPMFSIVNDAVYDGGMVHAAPAKRESLEPRIPGMPESAWIDVTATSSQGKWRPDEGDVLIGLVTALTQRVSTDEILVISPFKDVATRAKRELSRMVVLPGVTTTDDITVGTVHTAQGKQAKAVIFILGSDPSSEGSRRWAASKPNLMNVAVSRARFGLYVVGQRDQWADLPYFDTLAQRLRTVPGEQVSRLAPGSPQY